MDEIILKNSFLMMGNWVLLSLLTGLIVGLLLMIYRLIYPDSTAKIRYQTALISLVAMLIFTMLLAYLLPNISDIFMEQSKVAESEEFLIVPPLNEGIVANESNQQVNLTHTIDARFQYFTIMQGVLGIFWLGGIIIYSIKFIGGFLYLKILLKNASTIIPQTWKIKITSMQKELNIGSKLQLMIPVMMQ